MDPEERKLQIKLAQINTKVQIGLGWVFGSLATSLTLFIFSYQFYKDNLTVDFYSTSIVAFMVLIVAIVWIHRVNGYSNELENLK